MKIHLGVAALKIGRALIRLKTKPGAAGERSLAAGQIGDQTAEVVQAGAPIRGLAPESPTGVLAATAGLNGAPVRARDRPSEISAHAGTHLAEATIREDLAVAGEEAVVEVAVVVAGVVEVEVATITEIAVTRPPGEILGRIPLPGNPPHLPEKVQTLGESPSHGGRKNPHGGVLNHPRPEVRPGEIPIRPSPRNRRGEIPIRPNPKNHHGEILIHPRTKVPPGEIPSRPNPKIPHGAIPNRQNPTRPTGEVQQSPHVETHRNLKSPPGVTVRVTTLFELKFHEEGTY